MLIVPGADGEVGVLARHAPLVAMLQAGSTRVYVRRDGEVREFATGPGFFKVEQDRALALVDDALTLGRSTRLAHTSSSRLPRRSCSASRRASPMPIAGRSSSASAMPRTSLACSAASNPRDSGAESARPRHRRARPSSIPSGTGGWWRTSPLQGGWGTLALTGRSGHVRSSQGVPTPARGSAGEADARHTASAAGRNAFHSAAGASTRIVTVWPRTSTTKMPTRSFGSSS